MRRCDLVPESLDHLLSQANLRRQLSHYTTGLWPVEPHALLWRLGLCSARSLRPGHSIAVVRAVKSSLLAAAGGKGG